LLSESNLRGRSPKLVKSWTDSERTRLWDVELTNSRGGPAEMLKVSKPRQLAEGVTMSPARLMLEILAIYETFGQSPYTCMNTG
jgi:hypothetical protein